MNDAITEQIVQQLNKLSIVKKKAILELIKQNSSTKNIYNEKSESCKKALLSTSVWTDSEINEIFQAKDYINKWKPKQFF